MEDFARPGAEPPAVPGYDVGRCLGRGGSATVWLANERSTGRDVALKCFAPGGGTAGEGTDPEGDLRREVRILSALDHPHLVRAHAVVRLDRARDLGRDRAQEAGAASGAGLGLVLDYAPGGSLAALVAARGPLGAGETVTVLTPIAQALAYLHTHGVTHGDVAPGNVLFTAHGKPLLADLGVARMVADAATAAEHGTDGFRDPAPVDAVRAGLQPERDVYSLAALGWYCLSGRAPEPGDQRPPLPLLVPGVPAALAAALEAGLREDRRLRPTAAELATAVYRSAAAEPIDLSGSVHPAVIPELLTRHALPRTSRGLRAERLRGWSGQVTRRIRRNPAGLPVRAPAPSRPSARHAAVPGPDGRGGAGSARAGLAVLRIMSAVLALMLALAGASFLARAPLRWPFPVAPAAGPGQAADGPPAAAPPDSAARGQAPPATFPPATASPATVPQDIQALLGSEDPAEAVRGLSRLRSLALNSGDLGLLDEVNAPESPAAAADRRIGDRLRKSGHVLTGFSTVLDAVERATDSVPWRTVLAVTVAQSAYQERNALGSLVAEAGIGDKQRLRLVLVPVDGRWRIQEILPGRPAPG